ncbi:MAG: PD40 domain-containing protein [Anaerolineae bacterium]|nr:PD40 domain-containing protein [Anaerolineae bacterium]
MDGQAQLFLMKADGSDQRSLRRLAASDLTWSPDGTRLAFYSSRGRSSGVNGEISVMNADGTGLTALSNHPALDSLPAWRPEPGQRWLMIKRKGRS